MTIRKVWLKTCQFFIQDNSISAQKLKIGPGITGKIQPIMPTMANKNPMMMKSTFKLLALLLMVSENQQIASWYL